MPGEGRDDAGHNHGNYGRDDHNDGDGNLDGHHDDPGTDGGGQFRNVLSSILTGRGQLHGATGTTNLRLAAVTSALVETALEQRRRRRGASAASGGDEDSGDNNREGDDGGEVTSAEMFAASLTALEGTLFRKGDDDGAGAGAEEAPPSSAAGGSDSSSSPQVPLLRLLDLVVPYVSNNPGAGAGLYVSQFPLFSRVLRGASATLAVGTTTASSSAGDGGGGGGGGGAGMRQILSTTKNALIGIVAASSVRPPPTSPEERERLDRSVVRLLSDVILAPQYFDAKSPKVRRCAHSNAIELLRRYSVGEESTTRGAVSGLIVGHVGEYVHAVLSSCSLVVLEGGDGDDGGRNGGNKQQQQEEEEEAVRVLHLLHFLRQGAAGPLVLGRPTGTGVKEKKRGGKKKRKRKKSGGDDGEDGEGGGDAIGRDLVRLVVALVTPGGIAGNRSRRRRGGRESSISRNVMLTNSALSALLAAVEYDRREGASGEEELHMLRRRREMSSHVLASMLRCGPRVLAFASSSPGGGGGDSSPSSIVGTFSRLVAAAECDLLQGVGDGDDDAAPPVDEKHRSIGLRLLPLALGTVVNCCGACVEDEVAVFRGCCAVDLQRMSREGLPPLLSAVAQRGGGASLSGCTEAMGRLLQARFRPRWDLVLPVYASFAAELVLSTDTSSHDAGATMLRRLIELRSEVVAASGGGGRPDSPDAGAVEGAVGLVVDGVGIGRFFDLVVPRVGGGDGDGDGGPVVAEGGDGVRPDGAWVLSVLRSRAVASASDSAAERETDGSNFDTAGAAPAHLSLFGDRVLDLARRCDAAASSAAGAATAPDAAVQRGACVDLWSLLPTFCVRPADVAGSFPPLAPILARAIQDGRYPELVTIISTALRILAAGVTRRAEEGAEEEIVGDELDRSSHGDGGGSGDGDPRADLSVLSEMSVKILPTLFKTVETLAAEGAAATATESSSSQGGSWEDVQRRVHAVTGAISEFAKLCPKTFLHSLFKKVMHRLILATEELDQEGGGDDEDEDITEEDGVGGQEGKKGKGGGKKKRRRRSGSDASKAETSICTLLRLARALVSSSSLDESSVSLLYRAIKPHIRTDTHGSHVQKVSYQVLAELCDKYTWFMLASDEKVDETMELLVGSIMTCHVSARQMRLRCLIHVVGGLDGSNEKHMTLIPQIMGEVLLCLKDSNGKTRELAYELLLAMARVRDDNLEDYFQIILAALGAQTPHMRSAAVMALSRLVFEYARSEETVQALLPSLLRTVTVLFDEHSSREVTKSVVGFVRVCVAAMSPEQLEPLLPEVVGGLMKYGKGQGRFRAKIKIILKKLVRRYGYETITSLVPEGDARLLTHMRKLAERTARRRAAQIEDGGNDQDGAFEEMMESDEDDSDDGRTLMTGATGLTRMSARSANAARSVRSSTGQSSMSKDAGGKKVSTKSSAARIEREGAGEVHDMLGHEMMAKHVHFEDVKNGADDFDDGEDDDGIIEFDDMGRLVVHDDADPVTGAEAGGVDDIGDDDDADAENEQIIKFGTNKRRRVTKYETAKEAKAEANRRLSQKKQQKKGPRSLGANYKAKKAGGDVKKKGQQYEPYAFVPLDSKSYTKKNRGKAVSQMATVVRGGKRKRR